MLAVGPADFLDGVGRLFLGFIGLLGVKVMAGPPTSIPQRYSWIRIAQLAYNPWGGDPSGIMGTSVDLVVSDVDYLQQLHTASPQTPLMIYTNLSNIYNPLLADWLSYAPAHGLNVEDAFYHASHALSDGTPAGGRVLSTYGSGRYAVNPTAAFGQWAADYHRRYLDSNPLASGLFVDNSWGSPLVGFSQSDIVESLSSFAAGYRSAVQAVNQAIAPRWVIMNTAGGGANNLLPASPAYYEEFLLRPLAQNWWDFQDRATWVPDWQSKTSPPPYGVLDCRPDGGSPTDGRTQLAALCYYYLLADPVYNFLDFFGGSNPESAWSEHWCPAVTFNVGSPQGSWILFASGPDPSSSGKTYKVFGRTYTNALVLYKPISADQFGGSGVLSDSSVTTHDLGGTFSPVHADGTLGSSVTSISLRNGEGVILSRSSGPPPPPPPPPPVDSGGSLFGTAMPGRASVPDSNSVELGVRFSSDVDGQVTAVRFYKGSGTSNQHIGSVWDSTGRRLAQVTYTGETAGGWQQMSLPSPVLISAGQQYTVSYYETDGHYAIDENYFSSTVTAGHLAVPANGGVYVYSVGGVMPTNSWHGSNYWVDFVFQASTPPPPPPPPPTSPPPPPGHRRRGVRPR